MPSEPGKFKRFTIDLTHEEHERLAYARHAAGADTKADFVREAIREKAERTLCPPPGARVPRR